MSEAPRPTGFDAYVAAENAIQADIAAKQQAEAIEARRFTPEVQQLNSLAQSEIWGTNGRTDGYMDPTTGQPLTAPMKGIVNEIREDRRYGKSAAEREAKAGAYENEVYGLMAGGLELCQAKLVMDLRERDKVNKVRMAAKIMFENTVGKSAYDDMDAGATDVKVGDLYANKDYRRVMLIKEKGLFTAREYKEAIRPKTASTNPNGSSNENKVNETPDVAVAERSAELNAKVSRLIAQRDMSRKDYARRLAGRNIRTLHSYKGEFSKKAIAGAREQYEHDRKKLMEAELTLLKDMKVDNALFNQALEVAVLTDEYKLAKEMQNQEALASGGYREKIVDGSRVYGEDGIAKVERVEPKTRLGRGMRAFQEFINKSWERNSDGKLFSKETTRKINKSPFVKRLKKVGTAAAIGTAIGIPSAFAGSMLLGPVLGVAGGAYASKRFAQTMFSTRMEKHKSRAVADQRWEDIYNERFVAAVQGGRKDGPLSTRLAYLAEIRTNDRVKKNRLRMGLTAASMLMGAYFGEVIGQSLGAYGDPGSSLGHRPPPPDYPGRKLY